MLAESTCQPDLHALASELSQAWADLSRQYLPFKEENSIWRLSRLTPSDFPEQGWKLHVSATLMNASAMLKSVAPYLTARNIQFKAPYSLAEIEKLNAGIYYDYCQVGKVLTVYPRTREDALDIARQLHELTRGILGPMVPFDYRFRADGCVYYRYGSFQSVYLEQSDGSRIPAIRTPAGQLQPDSRKLPKPSWLEGSLTGIHDAEACDAASDNPLTTKYKVFGVLSQRGKGGVYQAVDVTRNPPRLCILKEGRRIGELSWDGRDGAARIRHEEEVLKALRAAGVNVPQVYGSFTIEQNQYLVLECIEGINLQTLLLKRKRRLSIVRALRLASQFAFLVARIHEAGWTWRDCKPANVILESNGRLRPLDFEGACRNDNPDALPWSTEGFAPLQWKRKVQSRQYEDLYALGATLYFLLSGRLLSRGDCPEVSKLRPNVPDEVCHLISRLLSATPTTTLSAKNAESVLVTMADYLDRATAEACVTGKLSLPARLINRGSERMLSNAGSALK
jgi:serine/threonine protein kinase